MRFTPIVLALILIGCTNDPVESTFSASLPEAGTLLRYSTAKKSMTVIRVDTVMMSNVSYGEKSNVVWIKGPNGSEYYSYSSNGDIFEFQSSNWRTHFFGSRSEKHYRDSSHIEGIGYLLNYTDTLYRDTTLTIAGEIYDGVKEESIFRSEGHPLNGEVFDNGTQINYSVWIPRLGVYGLRVKHVNGGNPEADMLDGFERK